MLQEERCIWSVTRYYTRHVKCCTFQVVRCTLVRCMRDRCCVLRVPSAHPSHSADAIVEVGALTAAPRDPPAVSNGRSSTLLRKTTTNALRTAPASFIILRIRRGCLQFCPSCANERHVVIAVRAERSHDKARLVEKQQQRARRRLRVLYNECSLWHQSRAMQMGRSERGQQHGAPTCSCVSTSLASLASLTVLARSLLISASALGRERRLAAAAYTTRT
jgi:hypothetical protein